MIEICKAIVHAEIRVCDNGIDAAYWAFTRQTRAKPPVLVVPHLYRRRAELRLVLLGFRGRV